MLTELQGLSERWYQAWLEKDATTVERLMAEDYVYVGPVGWPSIAAAILGDHTLSELSAGSWDGTEVVVMYSGHEAAIVRGRWQGAGSFEGTSFTDDNRCVLVWEKQAGELHASCWINARSAEVDGGHYTAGAIERVTGAQVAP